ncbi:hypothetical protein [Thalassomonas sp. M1454]|uniref:hypothetical protein n=1 Tax=Thalassomonas sp. M1454 TaxID=2594477 RepID=UPI00117CB9E8|nr:hypothetical protein [Thalassomonas sp. M1454]TRX54470.1 hypothetical protein FNN08_12120 [Thalassomonas sp. M1454]
MKKNDKNFEKALIKKLTIICEEFKLTSDGFSWLTHSVNFKDIANSLTIYCIYDTEKQRKQAEINGEQKALTAAITAVINELSVVIKPSRKVVRFDSEQACEISHKGNWQARLQQTFH